MTRKKKSVFVFDADDTLWPLGWLYDEAYLIFWLYLNRIFPGRMPCLINVFKNYFETDLHQSESTGVRSRRVADSMVAQYIHVCGYMSDVHGIRAYNPEHEAKIRKIAKRPFNFRRLKWFDDARRTLTVLKENGHKLCLLSSYDAAIFPFKNDFLNIWEFFDRANVFQTEFKKTKEDFIRASGWSKEREDDYVGWYTVGNGTSDMDPALEISDRWRGFCIPHMTTSPFFKEATSSLVSPDVNNPRVINLNNISKILYQV